MKKLFLTVPLAISFLITVSSCQSNAEKAVNNMKDVSEEYINNLNNANSKEEYIRLQNEYKQRGRFESNKLTDQDKEEYMKNANWEDVKSAQDVRDRVKEAERNAKERIKNQY